MCVFVDIIIVIVIVIIVLIVIESRQSQEAAQPRCWAREKSRVGVNNQERVPAHVCFLCVVIIVVDIVHIVDIGVGCCEEEGQECGCERVVSRTTDDARGRDSDGRLRANSSSRWR